MNLAMKSQWVISFLVFSISFTNALFEDQANKFDWASKHVGCPEQIEAIGGQSSSSRDGRQNHIVVSSKTSFGRISLLNGELGWRNLHSTSPGSGLGSKSNPKFFSTRSQILTVSDDGHLREFDSNTGVLNSQIQLDLQQQIIQFSHSNGEFAILSPNNLLYETLPIENKPQIKKIDLDANTDWSDIHFTQNYILAIGYSKRSSQVVLSKIRRAESNIETISLDYEKCIFSGEYLICISGKKDGLFLLDTNSNLKSPKHSLNAEKFTGIEALPISKSKEAFFIVQSSESTLLCRIEQSDPEKVQILLKSDRTEHYHATLDADDEKRSSLLFAAYSKQKNSVTIYSTKSDRKVAEIVLSTSSNGENSPSLKFLRLVSSKSGQFRIIVTFVDCRIDFYDTGKQKENINNEDAENVDRENDGNASSSSSSFLKWSRFEALASINSVEMVDFPLSSSQVSIETEFSSSEEPLLRAFVLRLLSQFEQLRLFFVAFSNSVVESVELIFKHRISVPTAIRRVFNLAGGGISGSRKRGSAMVRLYDNADYSSSASADRELERDFFNTRKVIVVTTLAGSVYGIDNENGQLIWSIYLGEKALPHLDRLGNPKISLFIQRGTAHFQFPGRAVVLFNSQSPSMESHLLVFIPINGQIVDRLTLPGGISRAELLPFLTTEMLHPLVLVLPEGKLKFYPDLPSKYTPTVPVYLFSVDPKNAGLIRGSRVDFETRKLVEVWQSLVPGFSAQSSQQKETTRLVSVSGKPFSQKVHSQGKVLGNRSVLYKYANPNLVAIASVDDEKMNLYISLVDGVSGRVVYSGRHGRAQEPVHLIHCENWIAYTYWNERARRTELTVIELYEGLAQTNRDNFDSFRLLDRPLQVLVQSYIFPQGVMAMTVSDTDQGLATRSVLVALPFGAIAELSRRIVDARRPFEMTQEMREEMIIPYMPEIPMATEDLISHNQTILGVRGIKTAPSGLESTSLVFAYGLDLFYTRVTPSGTFDILKDDFDYVLIAAVMIGLVLASVFAKKIWRRTNIKQAWA